MQTEILNDAEIACLRLIMQVGLARMASLVQTSNVLVSISSPVSTEKALQLEQDAQQLDSVFPGLLPGRKTPKPKRVPVPSNEKYGTKNARLIASIKEAMSTGITKRSEIMFYALSKNPDTCEYNFSNASRLIPNLVRNKGVWSLT